MRPRRIRITVRRVIVPVALVALGLWFYSLLGTRYAPGFSETAFATILPGMTPAEVEAILGPPLKEILWSQEVDVVIWAYSDSPIGDSHEMRWVVFKNKTVRSIPRCHWVEDPPPVGGP